MLVAQLCSNLCNPLECSPLGSFSTGFLSQEYWSGLPFPSQGDLPDPGIELASPALAGRFFTTEPPGKPSLVLETTLFFHLLNICLAPATTVTAGTKV